MLNSGQTVCFFPLILCVRAELHVLPVVVAFALVAVVALDFLYSLAFPVKQIEEIHL
ncbi:hypothetical protein D3C72_2204350 [compost metagenome]